MKKPAKALAISAALAGLFAGARLTAHESNRFGGLGSLSSLQNPPTDENKPKKDEAKPTDENKPVKVREKHMCKGQNACRGKGGCKSSDSGCKGRNSCKGKGGCATDGAKSPQEKAPPAQPSGPFRKG